MDIDSAFPSTYLKAADIIRDTTAIIASCTSEDVAAKGKPAEFKPVLTFANMAKGIVLNRTNADTIKAAYGTETANWIGKEVILFQMMTQFNGQSVPCIRMRINKNAASDGDVILDLEA